MIDISAWIEFLRDTGSPVCIRVDQLLGDDIATCDPIRMEVLAGARDERHLVDLRRLLARATVRKLIDCLIASITIRAGLSILHADADFEVLARHTDLRSEEP